MAFTTLMLFQVFNAFNARSLVHSAFRSLFRNRWLWAAVSISLGLHLLVIYVPFPQAALDVGCKQRVVGRGGGEVRG